MTQIQSITFHPYRFPFKEPLIGAHGRITERSGWVVAAHTGAHTGFGDIAPWPGFGTGIDTVKETIQSFDSSPFLGKNFTSASDLETLFDFSALPSEFVHGLEGAFLDALGREIDEPLAQVFDPWAKGRVRSHRLVADADSAAEAISLGFSRLKIKVAGLTLDRDLERLKAIRERIGSDVAIRVDANCGWDEETAGRAIEALQSMNIEWIEQPLKATDLEGHKALRERYQVPIALDESLAHYSIAEIVEAKAADALVIKPMFCGGLLAARKMILEARSAGLKVILTNALESAVGRQAAVHLAASLPIQLPACGFSDVLAKDWIELDSTPLRRIDPQKAGLGFDPSEQFEAMTRKCQS